MVDFISVVDFVMLVTVVVFVEVALVSVVPVGAFVSGSTVTN